VIFYDCAVYPAAMAILCAFGAYEMTKCIFTGIRIVSAAAMGLVCGSAVILFSDELFLLTLNTVFILAAVSVAAFCVCICLLAKKAASTKANSLLLVCALIYITVSFMNLCSARTLLSEYMFLMLFVCSWASDTLAYFIGRRFGKHKLAPTLSPKKTVEGAVAGVIAAAVAMLVFFMITDRFTSSFSEYIVWPLLGALTGAVSQAGDIFASAFKRHSKIKDYGKLFPGHGGVMDRFDSVLGAAFVSPVLMLFESLL